MARLMDLLKRQADNKSAWEALHAAVEAEDRPFTDEEKAQDDTFAATAKECADDIERHERKMDAIRNAPTPGTVPVEGSDGRIEVQPDAVGPFRTLGDQLAAIVQAGSPGGRMDDRLLNVQAASGASAGVGSDGGFLIQKDHSAELMKAAFETGLLTPLCSTTEIGEGSDGLEVVYIDETTRATGSRWGGLQVYRVAEAATVDAKKPKLGKWECRLEDMMGLGYLTERLMRDAPAMASVFRDGFVDEFAFMADDEIYRGTGVGQCLGILNSSALVTVAKETGQSADTIVTENLEKMWSRVLPKSQQRGVWAYNSECFPQLNQLSIGVGTGGQLVFMPPGGISGSPFASIYGRPAFPIEHAAALGDKGDIAFLDLNEYKLIRKGGIQHDESIHVRFLYNERTLRWVTAFNGAPKLKSAITPYKGSGTLSPFVVLAARA